MARFLSKKYPALIVKFSDGSRVQFQQGKVETEGKHSEYLSAFADQHPDYQIEQVEGDKPKEPTRKERLQAEARERGLSDAGTIADLEARLAEQPDGQDGEDQGEDGSSEDDSTDE